MKIIISEGNAEKIRLEYDSEGIKPMLSNYFTFDHPKAKFMKKYKNGMWDGKIRLFNSKNNTLPTGLIFRLKNKFCKDFNIELVDQAGILERYSESVDIKDLGKFVKELSLPFPPYEHQIKPLIHILKNKRCLIESPTNSGKSLIIYMLSEYLKRETDGKILIIVPRIGLSTQMTSDFVEYGGQEPFRIYGGVDKSFIKDRVMISTWQSVYDMPKAWFDKQGFEAVIVDEVHEAEGESIEMLLSKMPSVDYRIGLTGTLKESKVSELVLEGRFGPAVKFISSRELIDKGISSKLKIECLVFDYERSFREELGQGYSYADEIKFLLNCKERNDLIIKMAANLDGNTLVLFKHLDHGKYLFERLKEVSDVPVYYIAGSTDDDQREFVRKLAENEKCRIVASIGVFGMGISIKRLHYLVKAHPNKSKTQVLQAVGRILRKSPDGRRAMIIDIADDLSTTRKNFALQHAEERLRLYSQEKFDFFIKKISIKRKYNAKK